MKKILTALLSLTMIAGLSCTAFAAGITENGGASHSGVFAKKIENIENKITVPITDGNAEVVLPDGSEITIESLEVPAKETYSLVITPVKEDEAVAWFREKTQKKITNISVFDIYIENSRGERITNPGTAKIRITSAENYTEPIVLSLDYSDTFQALDSSYAGGVIAFQTNPDGFYVVGEKIQDSKDTTEQTDNPVIPDTGKNNGDSVPKTGDSTHITTWILTGLVSLLAGTALLILSRRKKNEQ